MATQVSAWEKTTADAINEKVAKLTEWEAADLALAKAKSNESRLRSEVVLLFWGVNPPDSGTENIPLNDGYKLKAVFKQNVTLADKEEVDKALTKIEKAGAEGKLLAERLIQWKPSLVKKEYDLLPDKYRKIINEVITTNPGTPSLAIVVPKDKK